MVKKTVSKEKERVTASKRKFTAAVRELRQGVADKTLAPQDARKARLALAKEHGVKVAE